MNHKALLVLGFTVAAGIAAANDGWVGNGGSPKLMAPHPTVRMLREKVQIHVTKSIVSVEAEFWFRNGGPTVTTNVGFPDESTDPDGQPVLRNFESWIDGKKVKTEFRSSENDGDWHVKRVTFPEGKVTHVRDRYVTGIGVGRLGFKDTFASYVCYVVRTGSSWKGTIGETDLRVTIDPSLPHPQRLVSDKVYDAFLRQANRKDRIDGFIRQHRHTVFYAGIGKPKRKGRELIFNRKNWRPTENDDLFLTLNVRQDKAFERRIQGK